MDRGGEWRWRESDTFVLRVFRSVDGGPTGLLHNVRTGEKLPFEGLESLGETLVRMTRPPGPPVDPSTAASPGSVGSAPGVTG